MKTIRNDNNYAIKQLADFKKMLESRLEYASNERDLDNYNEFERLYESDFILTFMGKSCRIAFGASEYYAVLGMIEDIIEEYNQTILL